MFSYHFKWKEARNKSCKLKIDENCSAESFPQEMFKEYCLSNQYH